MRRVVAMAVVGLLGAMALAVPGAAQSSGGDRIHLINGLPDTEVDVEIDGESAIDGFAFRDTHDLTSFAGMSIPSLVFRRAGTDEVVLDAGDVEMPASGNVSVLLHLKADGSVNLSIYENDVSRIAAGESRLVIRHLAAAPPVDVLAAGDVVFEALGNGQERSADLPAGEVSASLVPSGEDGPALVGPADLPLLEGVLLIVYGLGSLEDDTMTVLTESVEGLDTPPSAVNTGNSPVSDPATVPAPLAAGLAAAAVVALGLGVHGRRKRIEA